MKFFFNLFVWQ